MDDARIRQLTEEVLREVRRPASGLDQDGLERRVAALEARVAALGSDARPGAARVVHARAAALELLDVPGGEGGACSLEPDKPCVGSGRCRSFGH